MRLSARTDSNTPAQEPSRPARLYAAWLLGRREWSAKELETRLKLKGYGPVAIDECLAYLQSQGLQADSRYAEVRVRSKARMLGNRRLKQDLSAKGISPETAAEALAQAGDETERAIAAASRFNGQELTPELKAKAWRFLMSRGFSSDAIKAALAHVQGSD